LTHDSTLIGVPESIPDERRGASHRSSSA